MCSLSASPLPSPSQWRPGYIAASVAEGEIEQLLRHELVHVGQIARLGFVRFYWRYLREYITLRRRGFSSAEAYQRISFEVEAFAAEKIL